LPTTITQSDESAFCWAGFDGLWAGEYGGRACIHRIRNSIFYPSVNSFLCCSSAAKKNQVTFTIYSMVFQNILPFL
jgi:hypothetical protein